MMKKTVFLFVTLMLLAGTLAAQAKKQEPAPAPPAAEQDTAFFVIHSQGKWVGMEAISVTKERPEGQLLLKHVYESQVDSEAGLGYTSSRGECRFVADTQALIDGTFTKFNDDVILADVQLKRDKTKLITSALGAELPPKEADIPPNTKLAAPWMAEEVIMANQPLNRGLKISCIEFTGDLGSLNATREVSISVVASQERTIAGRPVTGWQAEITFPYELKAAPIQLFLDLKGRILEKVQGETVFTRVATREETQLAKTYVFTHRGRRDPFGSRLVYVGKGKGPVKRDGDGGKPPVTQTADMSEVEAAKHVEDADGYLAEMKRMVVEIENEEELNTRLGELFQLVTAKKEQLAQTKHEQHKKRIAEIEQEAKSVFGPQVRIAQEAKAIAGVAKMMFDSEQYDKIGSQKKKLEDVLGLAEVRQNPNLEKEIKGHLLEVTKLLQRGLIRQDFASKKLRVTGIVYAGKPVYEDVSFTVNILGRPLTSQARIVKWISESVAVIAAGPTEEEVKEGSQVVLIKDSKIFIQRIDPGAVIFLFEGESIRVPKAW